MLNNYNDEVNLLLTWYKRTKEIVIKAESMDLEGKAYIQPLHEQRYCLDHFMRAIAYEINEENEELLKKSIHAAIGHLQRAYADSIEWMLITVKEEYFRILEQYTNEQISLAFPEYFSEIRPRMDSITEIINEYKKNKSIEKVTDSLEDGEKEFLDDVTGEFVASDIASELQNYLKIIHSKESVLIETRKRDRKNGIKDKIVWPIVTAVIASLITLLFTT